MPVGVPVSGAGFAGADGTLFHMSDERLLPSHATPRSLRARAHVVQRCNLSALPSSAEADPSSVMVVIEPVGVNIDEIGLLTAMGGRFLPPPHGPSPVQPSPNRWRHHGASVSCQFAVDWIWSNRMRLRRTIRARFSYVVCSSLGRPLMNSLTRLTSNQV